LPTLKPEKRDIEVDGHDLMMRLEPFDGELFVIVGFLVVLLCFLVAKSVDVQISYVINSLLQCMLPDALWHLCSGI
jgi:hypothetical protein